MKDDEGGRMYAQDIINEPEEEWICTKLEIFGCEICGMPRPDITRDLYGRPSTDFVDHGEGGLQGSFDLQRKVCARLGRLTSLRQMTLRTPPLYQSGHGKSTGTNRMFDCFAMTLENGLDLLEGLKGLKIVGWDDMEVTDFSYKTI